MTAPILIVEDDKQTIFLYQAILKRAGLESLSASDVAEACQILRKITPALVLLDLGLPGRSGTELLEWLRQTPGLQDTPVIVISAYQELVRTLAEWPDNQMLVKPVNADTLLQMIQDMLAG